MTYLINLCYIFTNIIGLPNYGLAIIFLTVLIKLVLYPLTLKQMRSMAVMQQLAPKVKEIQAKYKEKDPQKMQKKIMELYQEKNVNPLAGCLPMLIQLPILIALYRALLHFDYSNPAHANFFWISSLSQMGDYLYILPVLAGVSTYFQTQMTMTTNDPTQKIMLFTMPIFIAWICTTVPAGLALYWVIFNILGIIQQYFINKQMIGIKEAASESGSSRKGR
jgi:YidC/Oxa1 family membrane protein insertase